MKSRFSAALQDAANAIEAVLDGLLPMPAGAEAPLVEAMRYSTLGGGKRLRPFLVLQSAGLFDVAAGHALRVGAALEMVHCYSLVHDDLPAMDDDDLRRGRPTTHRRFDEATAILAGDALLTRAFEVLAAPATHPKAEVRSELVLSLAIASGAEGMAGGQMIDLEAEHKPLDLNAISRLQRLKTGALFGFACESGAILGQGSAPARRALLDYAHDMGLAFQIADDLLDAEGATAEVGKRTGKDAASGKATFVSLLGLDGARRRAAALADSAASRLDLFGDKADLLRYTAHYVVERRA